MIWRHFRIRKDRDCRTGEITVMPMRRGRYCSQYGGCTVGWNEERRLGVVAVCSTSDRYDRKRGKRLVLERMRLSSAEADPDNETYTIVMPRLWSINPCRLMLTWAAQWIQEQAAKGV